jgi:hypothetical protein
MEEIPMKIRNGFVSNSSSSSFVVGFDLDCHTFEEFCKNVSFFGRDLDTPVENYDTYIDKPVTYRECLKKLWDDLQIKGPCVNENKLEKWFMEYTKHGFSTPETGFYFNEYQFVETCYALGNIANEYPPEKRENIVKKLEKIGRGWNTIVAKALMHEMLERYSGNLYFISYSDDDGDMQSLMEHGDFWNIVPHVRINNH